MTLEQVRIFSIFFALGIVISILFEFFRVLRKNIKTGYLGTSIEDIIYILISGFLFFKSLILFTNGNIRFYIFLAFIFRNYYIFFDNKKLLWYNFYCNN